MSNTIQEYKCPCCGGAIAFDSAAQKLKCPYCDTEFDIDTLKDFNAETTKKDDIDWNISSGKEWTDDEAANLRSYVCTSCGGEIVCEATTTATSCPFCGNPVVMLDKLSGKLRPDYVIPFKLDKRAAKAGLERHLSGKKLLPKIFKDQNHIDEIKGVYVPFWLFDSDADADLTFNATRVRTWSDRDYNYTETEHFLVSRSGSIGFDHIPVDGSKKMPDDLMESIEPYDFSEAVDFRTAYLAGFFADKYDVTAEESIERANERVKNSAYSAFASTVDGYATVTPRSSSITLHGGDVKYALYPVWLLNTTWNGKQYTFAMNGQTGKFIGDLPVDHGAAARWTLGLTLGIGAAVYLLMYFLFGSGLI